MANACNYEITVIAPREVCYFVYASMPIYEDKYIDSEEPCGDLRIMRIVGDCKWSIDAYTSDDFPNPPELQGRSEEELDKLGQNYWEVSLRAKSKAYACHIEALSWSEESEYRDYIIYKNGERAVSLPPTLRNTGENSGLFRYRCETYAAAHRDMIPDSVAFGKMIAKMPANPQKELAVMHYLKHADEYTDPAIVADRCAYLLEKKADFIHIVLKQDLQYGMQILLEQGGIEAGTVLREYLRLAEMAKAAQCVQYLRQWLENNVEKARLEALYQQEAQNDPYNSADMKKLWKTQKLRDKTLWITEFKGNKPVYFIPPRIGKTPVSGISTSAFNGTYSTYKLFQEDVDGNVILQNFYMKCNRPDLTEIVIPEGITVIGDIAFSGCKSLTSITIPDSVTTIGDRAFDGCSSLTSITIPDSVTSIGRWAFWGCSSLTSITIPNGIASIGSGAFSGCSSLTNITIPESVTSIDGGAFEGCSSLASITIPDSVKSIADSAFYGCKGLCDENGDLILNHRYCYYSGMDQEKQIPFGVTSICNEAFSKCSSLTSVTIPDSVTSIGENAFSGCSSLTSITIPDSVTSISAGTFSGCSSLTIVTLPNSVTSIGGVAYRDGAFAGCSSLTSITIPDSVTTIGDRAFDGCSSLTSITIPDSVTSIGREAFSWCSNLRSITIPDSVKSIGDGAFSACHSLTSITLPESITSIGRDVFLGCRGLCDENGDLILNHSYYYYSGEKQEKQVPSGVTSICGGAFSSNKSLTSVTLPDSVTSIGNSAFYWCINLKSITIPEGVTSIEDMTFDECVSLERVTLPKSVTSIEGWPFRGCRHLTIYAPAGSYAEEYAKKKKYKFEAI